MTCWKCNLETQADTWVHCPSCGALSRASVEAVCRGIASMAVRITSTWHRYAGHPEQHGLAWFTPQQYHQSGGLTPHHAALIAFDKFWRWGAIAHEMLAEQDLRADADVLTEAARTAPIRTDDDTCMCGSYLEDHPTGGCTSPVPMPMPPYYRALADGMKDITEAYAQCNPEAFAPSKSAPDEDPDEVIRAWARDMPTRGFVWSNHSACAVFDGMRGLTIERQAWDYDAGRYLVFRVNNRRRSQVRFFATLEDALNEWTILLLRCGIHRDVAKAMYESAEARLTPDVRLPNNSN